MTTANRFKLLAGLLGVLVLVGLLTVVFNQRQSQVSSISAAITAQSYPVGADYGGIVLDRLVDDGATVAEGQPILTIASPSLQADLAEGLVQPTTVGYQVSADGVITLAAPVAGVVNDITTERGSFVQAGQVLATVDRSGSLSVSAQLLLDPTDYGRVELGAPARIILPNNQVVEGTVADVAVEPAEGKAQTTVVITSTALAEEALSTLTTPGTPVTAVIELRDDGILAGVGDDLVGFLRTIGL
jgi:multidrug resistance efflux pump